MVNVYATTDEVKDALIDGGSWGSGYDAEITRLVTAASRLIDIWCDREPGAFNVTTDTMRFYTGSGLHYLYIDDMADLPTTVAVDEGYTGVYTEWVAGTDYRMFGYGEYNGPPWFRIETVERNRVYIPTWPRGVRVTGKFGYSLNVPSPIKEATIIQTARWFKRAQQAFQDTGAVQELGQLKYTKKIDPDVEIIINRSPYKKAPLV